MILLNSLIYFSQKKYSILPQNYDNFLKILFFHKILENRKVSRENPQVPSLRMTQFRQNPSDGRNLPAKSPKISVVLGQN